tara:strand:+ start:4303 stop:5091 length:789 start_codon:yes stop_codon:yes gene_type:complete
VIVRAKKSLGQNFLHDKKILKLISECADIRDKEILEIGPGTGNLTSEILNKKPKKFFIVEKDKNLIILLKKRFNQKVFYINEDVLKISEENLTKNKLIVFGNLPFNISTEILTKWIINLDTDFWFEKLVLMFQKEVADRIISSHNSSEYGRLSIISNWKLNIKKIIDIKPTSFKPIPKVDSTLLVFEPKKKFFRLKKAQSLENITKVFFNQRRKKIKKPMKMIFSNFENIAEKLNIDLNLRPQNLDLETYFKIAEEFEKLNK